ncbi:MAG: hypothetical protein ACKO7Z_02175 [Cyanobacteriota bacterium]
MSSALQLEPVLLSIPRDGGPLLPRIQRALAARGEPLRWAITAVESDPAGTRLWIEAVVIRPGA